MKRKYGMKVLLSLPVFLVFLFVAGGPLGRTALGDDAPPPVFSNQDLEQYGRSSGYNPPVASKVDRKEELREKSNRIREEKDREYWCKKAGPYRKKIERAKDDIAEIEAERGADGSLKKAAKARLERARKLLKNAEQDLTELEDEARRKSVPP